MRAVCVGWFDVIAGQHGFSVFTSALPRTMEKLANLGTRIASNSSIVLAATLSAVGGTPVAGLAWILGIDRFMPETHARTNLVGNGVAALVLAKWTGDLDMCRLRVGLNNPGALEADDPEAMLDRKIDLTTK